MFSKIVTLSILAAPAVLAAPVHAQPPADALDVTMVLLPEHATGPKDITRRIELPPAKGSENADNRGRPEDRGNAAGPPEGAGEGRDTAEQARERGREFGQQISEQARENREQAGHGQPPEPPGPPESPGRPESPGESNPVTPTPPGNPSPGPPDTPRP
ncbi:MAG TPA: hypothetical protein VFJ95_01555 [Gammaproteobacteria bacterium]|nr:hypothetical protein [Gammaproteobacteria bacterium]